MWREWVDRHSDEAPNNDFEPSLLAAPAPGASIPSYDDLAEGLAGGCCLGISLAQAFTSRDCY